MSFGLTPSPRGFMSAGLAGPGGGGGPVPGATDLGRFRYGDPVTVAFTPASKPDDVPVAAVSPHGITLPVTPDRRRPGRFAATLRHAAPQALGTVTCAVTYTSAGSPVTLAFTWELVAGGDSGGEVVALYAAEPPEGRFVLAQLGSGRIAQGDDPAPYQP